MAPADLVPVSFEPRMDVALVSSAVVMENARVASGVAVLLEAQERTSEVIQSTFEADLRAVGVFFDSIA